MASLGMHVDAVSGRLTFARAELPGSIDWVQFSNLQVGEASIDLRFERHPHDVGVTVLRRDGRLEIIAVK